VFDAQLEPEDSVLLAALARGLVAAALDEEHESPSPPPELLDASLWHAARDGIGGTLVHPLTGQLESARVVVDALVDRVRQQLELGSDLQFVTEAIDRIFREGTGADRQRAAHARGSIIRLGDVTEVH